MKKFGAVSLALALATVGGVYATWMFSGKQAAEVAQTLQFGIESAKVDTARGSYTFEVKTDSTANKLFSIDQESPTSHKAVLHINGSIVIRFTPSEIADEGIREKGLTTIISSESTIGKYTIDAYGNYAADGTGVPVLSINEAVGKYILPIGESGEGVYDDWENWEEDPETIGSFRYTITKEKLEARIKLTDSGTNTTVDSEGFVIDNVAEYKAFSDVVTACKILFRVTDATPTDVV